MTQPPTDHDLDRVLAAVKAETERRVAERVAKGECRRHLLVVGHVDSIPAAEARATAELRAAGEKRPIAFSHIVTGVPRPGRDDVVPGLIERWQTSQPDLKFDPHGPRS
jgi:hypothetical protein